MEGVRPYTEEQLREYKRQWPNTTIIDAFNRTCDTHPEKEALVEGEQRLTFSQVREQVRKAALAFLKLGLGKESVVLFQIPNWVEVVYAYLGLKTIGAIPVLLFARHGKTELERFCGLTEAVAWIGPTRYGRMEYIPIVKGLKERYPHMEHLIVVRDEAPPGTISLSRLMEETGSTEGTTDNSTKFSSSPDDIIHLAATGGTTGLPKLVPKTQNEHLCKTYYFTRHLERGYGEVMLPVGPLTHDAIHLFNLCVWILFGGKLVFCPSTRPKDLLEQIEKERVTFFFVVPTLLVDILKEPDLEKYDLSSLSAVMCGGSHIDAELVEAAVDKLKVCFHSGYGSTEGAGAFTVRYDPLEVVTTTSGRGMCPYDIYRVVDEEGNEVALGQEGEIIVRGPSMFTGYYKSEEENRVVFTPDGFYHTGDLGKLDHQGNIIITGRKKDIIRRGGESISASEVEDMITGHPKVVSAAVIGMPDPRLGERICAYVQPLPGKTVSLEEIVSYLKAQGVSVLLFPERIELVEELPPTAMDKVDKKKLREDISKKLKTEGKD